MFNDILLHTIIELKEALDQYDIPLIIGGGMGIYLRRLCLTEERQPQYDQIVELRTTNDIDIFLGAELIVDSQKIIHVKEAVSKLNYSPIVQFLQFSKQIEYNGTNKEVKIDLLACPPATDDLDKVKISNFRIRPKNVNKIHAYLTEEARGLSNGLITINLKELFPKKNIKSGNLFVPSRFNYIILKLNAFNDRKDDKETDYGRHHAYDIFACVTDMTEEDWNMARTHFDKDINKSYMKKTILIQNQLFNSLKSIGVIRIKENISYKKNKKYFDDYIPKFINDLKELFSL